MRQILREQPEVLTVTSQLGRPDDGTDVTGFHNLEFFAPLKPFEEWPRGLTKEKLTAQLQQRFQYEFPGEGLTAVDSTQGTLPQRLVGCAWMALIVKWVLKLSSSALIYCGMGNPRAQQRTQQKPGRYD